MKKRVDRNYKVNLLKSVSYKEIIHTPKKLVMKSQVVSNIIYSFTTATSKDKHSPVIMLA